MVKIPSGVYLLLGASVLYVSNKIDPQKFKLFIWAGYLFLIIGIAKLAIWFISKKKESPKEIKDIRHYTQQQRIAHQQRMASQRNRGVDNQQTTNHQNQQQRTTQQNRTLNQQRTKEQNPQQSAGRYCPRCGNASNHYANFCVMCGQRLR